MSDIGLNIADHIDVSAPVGAVGSTAHQLPEYPPTHEYEQGKVAHVSNVHDWFTDTGSYRILPRFSKFGTGDAHEFGWEYLYA